MNSTRVNKPGLIAFFTRPLLRAASKELRASQRELNLLRNLLDALPVGLHTLSHDGIILDVNSTEAEMLGYKKSEMLGKSFLDFIPPEQREEAWGRFKQKLRGERVEKITHRICTRKDGGQIFVTSEDKLAQDEHGDTTGITTVLIDITEFKQMQSKVVQLETFSQIAEGIAHHFNNLLAVILMATDLLKTVIAADSPAQDKLRIITESCMKGRRFIDILNAYKYHPLPVIVAMFDPKNAIVAAVQFLNPALAERKINVFQQFTHTCGAKAVAGELTKAVSNLCNNALQALPSGGSIYLKTEDVIITEEKLTATGACLLPGKYILLTVEDNGEGIPEAIQPKIFDPFFSTDPSHLGLGLFQVRHIIESWGGEITFESQSGKGTKFKVYLPAVER